MEILILKNSIQIKNIPCLNLDFTLDCGQAFRWEKSGNIWQGVAGSYKANIIQDADGLVFMDTDIETFENIWRPYFDLDRDYAAICETLSEDKILKRAINDCYGIRILRQDPWETICSFIISQNNNIPRIKGIISRLCENFGTPLGGGAFSFPSAKKIASLDLDDLSVLRAGFRAKYIKDAAEKISSGVVNIKAINNMSLDDARTELIKIKGVGAKVAECSLLFGFGRIGAFPIDVWIKRVMEELYPGGLPECTLGAEGIAQQYLFHWRRTNGQLQAADKN